MLIYQRVKPEANRFPGLMMCCPYFPVRAMCHCSNDLADNLAFILNYSYYDLLLFLSYFVSTVNSVS